MNKSYEFSSSSELHDLLSSAGKPLKGAYRQMVEFDSGQQEENDIFGQYRLIADENGETVPLFIPAKHEEVHIPFVISEGTVSVYGLGSVLSRKCLDQ